MSKKATIVDKKPQQNGTSGIQSYGAIDDITAAPLSESTPGAGTTVPNGDPGGPSGGTDPQAMEKRSTIKVFEKIGFGLGHVYNDLCAGVWFSYTLLFMQGALGMPATEAGALVMLGQVGDAIATPIVGFLTDKYGTKRQWHIAGTLIVFFTFPMIFSLCPWCDVAPHWWEIVYFAIVILTFQFGWPIVQITHLAMIPELSRTQKDRSDLTAVRYSVSIISNVVVYIVTWAVLRSRSTGDSQIGAADAYRFRDIALILTLVGVSMSVLFNFSLTFSGYEHRRHTALQHNVISGPGKERPNQRKSQDPEKQALLRSEQQHHDSNGEPAVAGCSKRGENGTVVGDGMLKDGQHDDVVLRKPKKNFFRSPLLYQNALLYVFSRLFMTTSLVYMPLWLDERSLQPDPVQNNASVEHLATVPLVSFLASFIASLVLKYSNRYVGNSWMYLVGSAVSLSVCTWIALSTQASTFSTLELLVIASLFGAGSSITMISSLCITADMIGKHADQGGFIYSAVTFTDKLITGIVVVIIESMKCHDRADCPDYYRSVLAYACGTAAGLGCVTLASLACTRPRVQRRTQVR
ncbi:major facilitator superfamily domain-containing protein 12-like [Uranotaenia lowii]|uniref:major facilitator superfamily domain-containing protein 12-like n=1 Tax=Uranotaenia lowii TaxID=190385 RepID=UPI0024789261|nr:major facilitator superfamily domain-containing protein 12-like [Uranotaenia lowii]XP_055600855.1 major facilitator superfamily domain-containing protein 12-like [Uranotaenia lowii]XP_055600856.1 major facilitator superfamily domain-containing protein 12-like [Uranotaenia lowii]XP_055600857.1 major facilitator superfamily domain-containing protein 12-like [Uranotaenia lowii]XP_055600858.1 major facilitator superfamily domain-containing protein 12-like [Uranotaenia lowii]XP_055600859.1 major